MNLRTARLLIAVAVLATLVAAAPRTWFLDHPLIEQFIGRTEQGTPAFGDDEHYHHLAQYFRGELPPTALRAPFAYRVGLPAMVAVLPFRDIDLTFRTMNALWLVAAHAAIGLLCLALGGSLTEAVWAIVLAALSFGTFWYGPTNYPEGPVLFFLTVCLYFLQRGNRTAFWIACTVGVLFKEWLLMVLPVVVTLDWLEGRSWGQKAKTMALAALPLVVQMLPRYAFRNLPQFIWTPSFERVLLNLSRPRALISTLLTLATAAPLLMLAYRLRAHWWPRWRACGSLRLVVVAVFWFAALPAYGLVSAYLDGRFVWMLYPVLMPLAAAGLCAGWAWRKEARMGVLVPAQAREA